MVRPHDGRHVGSRNCVHDVAYLAPQRLGKGVTGVPTSYEIDGMQYLAVQSGWGVDAQRKQELLDKAFGNHTLSRKIRRLHFRP